ncbi:hypothetical protein Aglo03_26550 [Actinokineospora globicatena]|uniref:Uncharacterized protein n=1 Tax=Actinokineospora globicatena TaxID=103729 RepID=A0A9W6QNQ3_9PSEU|nr:hypothetical protein Aglo03_26550 [Actinokineospora globicatena]
MPSAKHCPTVLWWPGMASGMRVAVAEAAAALAGAVGGAFSIGRPGGSER